MLAWVVGHCHIMETIGFFLVQIRLHYPDRKPGHRKEINGSTVAAGFRGPVSTEIFNTLALPLIYIY